MVDGPNLDIPPEVFKPDFDVDTEQEAHALIAQAFGAPPSAWHIEDTEGAAWAMSKWAAAQREALTVDAQAQRFHAQIDAWHARAGRKPNSDAAWFEGMLAGWLRREHHLAGADGAVLPKGVAASTHLPNGSIESRKVGARFDVDDADALLAWCEGEHPELVRHLPPSKTDLKAVVEIADKDGEPVIVDKVTAEVVPGVSGVSAYRSYSVSLPD